MNYNKDVFSNIVLHMQNNLTEMSRMADKTIEQFANNSLGSREEEDTRDLIAKLMEISLDMLHMDKKLENLKK